MATTKSDIYSVQSATGTGDNRADGRLLSGKVRQAHATVTLAGDEADAAVISFVELPKGAIVDPSQSYIMHEDLGGTISADVGFASDPDGLTLNGALDLASAGKTFLDAVSVAPVTIAEGDEVLTLTLVTSTTPTADAKARAVITFIDRN